MLRCGHLFLFACGCVVAQRSTPGHWIQLSRSDHGIPAIRNGISTPTACLPAFTLPHHYHERNAMPGHCVRAGKHMRRALHPVLPLYLQTSVPNAANDVAESRPQRSISCLSPCSSPLRTTAPVPAYVLP